MQSGCRKKKQKKKHLLNQIWLKNEFATGAAFNIKLHSRVINVPKHQ